ncbi:MAG TPA: aminoacyl-tRNA hydrolase [Acidimicrobiales bacterium]|nr:aminoacyl-tRNA hydrolase [Acidimicrobiales bacterium]
MFRRRHDGATRRGTPSEWLIVGLANPGVEYRDTRHNLGAAVVEELARRAGASLRVEPRLRARLADVVIDGHRVLVAVPTTYVNESGAAVVPLVRRSGLDDETRILIVHDELDLEPGRLQLKTGGGLAGHNGLRSISGALGTDGYSRLRVGVGKPPSKDRGADWVLGRPGRDDRAVLDAAVVAGADALEDVVRHGLEEASVRLNGARGA